MLAGSKLSALHGLNSETDSKSFDRLLLLMFSFSLIWFIICNVIRRLSGNYRLCAFLVLTAPHNIKSSPPLKTQQHHQSQSAYTAEYSKYPVPAFTQFDVQYNTHGSSHTADPTVDVSGSYYSQSCAQDRIMQAPKLTHL